MRKLAVVDNSKITILKNIGETEFEAINRDLISIKRFDKGFRIYSAVTDGYKDYNQMIELFQSQKIENEYIAANINRFVANYLTGIQAFLDRWPKYLSKNFNEELIDVFKQATYYEYDNYFAYRFIEQLRNYVQHRDVPPLLINGYLKNNKRELAILFDATIFLKDKKIKSIVRNELEKMPSSFDITPYFVDMNNCLLRIHNKMLSEIISKELIQSCLNILELIKEYENYNGDFVIIDNPIIEDLINVEEFIYENGTYGLNLEFIPLAIVTFIINTFIKQNK